MRVSLLLWVVFAAIVVGVSALLLRACGLAASDTWRFCPARASGLDAAIERRDELERQIARLRQEIAQRQLACARIPPPAPPPLELPRQAGEPRPQQTAEKQDLPQDRWDRKDLGILDGCWRLGRDAMGSSQRGPHVESCVLPAATLCFRPNGAGGLEATFRCPTHGNSVCQGAVVATFLDDGMLRIVQSPGRCSNGAEFRRGVLRCRRVDQRLALCRAGDGQEENVKEFRR